MDARQTCGDRRKARPGAWATLAVAAVLLSVLPVAVQAAGRVALVIGNSAYEHVPLLANPGNDARAVGDAFERLGYAVTRLEDAGYDALRRGLLDFTRAASASDVAVVFYAGHGMEVDGRNFLVPVDAALARDTDVEYEAVSLALVTRAVGGARRLGLAVLDACRDNPFVAKLADAGATRSIGRGLARVAPSGGTLVAYAAEDGKTADDDAGKGHSPYTEALLRYLEEPGLEVGWLFRKVRPEVERITGGRQTPIEYGKLPDEVIYLASAGAPIPPSGGKETAGGETATTPPPPPSGDAARAYEAAERVGTVAAYQGVVKHFPGTFEAELARAQIAKLEGAKEPLVVAGGDAVEEEPSAVTAPSPEAVEGNLKLSREDRRLVQMGLAAAGYSPGPADGMLGGKTRRALRAWQESKEVEATGYLTREQSVGLVALGREESERRVQAERERKEREARLAEERRRAEAERKAREAAERRRAEAERKAREAEERRRREQSPGTKLQDCPECPEMVVVPSGRFMMGSRSSGEDDERPVHEVTIARPFAVGVYEVTFGEWDACVSDRGCGGYRPYDEGWGRGRRPVINVSWNDAKAYVRWLSEKTGEAYRLLSEAEWEYVARAGTRTKFWWGNDVGRNRANCDGCGSRWDNTQTAPVGAFSANPFGLHDVHGNVYEWTEDCWNGSYHGAPSDGSAWESGNCGRRVVRGGSWNYYPWGLSALRIRYTTGDRNLDAGFRVARTLTP